MGCTQIINNRRRIILNKELEQIQFIINLTIGEDNYEISKDEFSLSEFYFNDLEVKEKLIFNFRKTKIEKEFNKYIRNYKNFNNYSNKIEFINYLFDSNPKKFKKILALVGVPQKFRIYFWIKCMNIDYNIEVKNYDYYLNMEDEEVSDQVLKDVKRTKQKKLIFKDKNQPGFKLLYRICKAIGSCLKDTKYVQGMNFIAVSILEITGLKEHLTFEIIRKWMVKKDYMFLYIFNNNFPMVNFLRNIYQEIMKKKMKNILLHLEKVNFFDELWFFKWYFSLFFSFFPKYYSIRFLDFIITGDLFSLVYLTLSIINNLEKEILKMNFEQLNNLFNNNEEKLLNSLDIDIVIFNTKNYTLSDKEKQIYIEKYLNKIEIENKLKLEDSQFLDKLKRYIPEVSDQVKKINQSGYSKVFEIQESISVLDNDNKII